MKKQKEGLHKPDPEIFKEVMRESGAIPERSVMIDDLIERGLAPARDLGMKTVWLDWGYRKNPPTRMNYKITKLKDLFEIF